MGQTVALPVQLVRVERRRGAAWRAGVAEMQGWRERHEDAHFLLDAERPGAHAVFGVLDGHAGAAAARLLARHLPKALRHAADITAGNSLAASVQEAFVQEDSWLRLALEGADISGSTCASAGLCAAEGSSGAFCGFVANAGDSRGLIVRRGSNGSLQEILASKDHKPERPDERARIVHAGGFVNGCKLDDVPRLDGYLAVSRGFGDFSFKRDASKSASEQKVSCIPEVVSADMLSGDLIILACDGVFDVMSSEALVDRVLRDINPDRDLGELAAQILEECLAAESDDNMTLMIVEAGEPRTGMEEAVGLLGLERYGELRDESTKQLYRAFLKYCAETGNALSEEGQNILKGDNKPGSSNSWLDQIIGAFLYLSDTPSTTFYQYLPQQRGSETKAAHEQEGGMAGNCGPSFESLAELSDVLLAHGLPAGAHDALLA